MQYVETLGDGPVRHVVITRPEKRNALSFEVYAELVDALGTASSSAAVRCVVVRGAGGMFSAGNDVGDLRFLADHPERVPDLRPPMVEAMHLLERMPKPTIAQVHGLCLGGAMELALAADVRILARTSRIGLPETSIGLLPDLGGCSRLPAVVGLGRAKELVMTARLIDADEAYRIGFANAVADDDDLDETVRAWCTELVARAPLALALAKRILDSAAKPGLDQTLEQEVMAQTALAHSADFREGAGALADRRSPAFAGR